MCRAASTCESNKGTKRAYPVKEAPGPSSPTKKSRPDIEERSEQTGGTVDVAIDSLKKREACSWLSSGNHGRKNESLNVILNMASNMSLEQLEDCLQATEEGKKLKKRDPDQYRGLKLIPLFIKILSKAQVQCTKRKILI